MGREGGADGRGAEGGRDQRSELLGGTLAKYLEWHALTARPTNSFDRHVLRGAL